MAALHSPSYGHHQIVTTARDRERARKPRSAQQVASCHLNRDTRTCYLLFSFMRQVCNLQRACKMLEDESVSLLDYIVISSSLIIAQTDT